MGPEQKGNANGWFWPNGSGTFSGLPPARFDLVRRSYRAPSTCFDRNLWNAVSGFLLRQAFADLVALCNFLPGPTSSQVCYSIGMTRGGIPGALSAWSAFTLPSAIIMLLAAYGIHWLSGNREPAGFTA